MLVGILAPGSCYTVSCFLGVKADMVATFCFVKLRRFPGKKPVKSRPDTAPFITISGTGCGCEGSSYRRRLSELFFSFLFSFLFVPMRTAFFRFNHVDLEK